MNENVTTEEAIRQLELQVAVQGTAIAALVNLLQRHGVMQVSDLSDDLSAIADRPEAATPWPDFPPALRAFAVNLWGGQLNQKPNLRVVRDDEEEG